MSGRDADAARVIDGGPLGLTVTGNRWDLLPRPSSPPTASVIITFYEQHDELDRVLAGLSTQRGPVTVNEIIVVDDGSRRPPDLPPALWLVAAIGGPRQVPVVVLSQEDCGCRPAAARNLGVTRATGEVLVFFDGDTVPDPDAVQRLAALPAVAPEAVVVGRREYCELDGWRPDDVRSWLTDGGGPGPQRYDRPAWLDAGYTASANLLEADDRSYQFVIGAIMATSRRFFDEIGGFDATIDCYGGEDWEIANRAWCSGAILAHVPDAVGYHHGPDWRGREGEQATKNPERLALASRIPGRNDAVRGPFARVVATVHGDAPDDAVVATIASLLRAGDNQILVAVHHPSAAVATAVAYDSRVTCGELSPATVARSVLGLDVLAPAAVSTAALAALIDLTAGDGHGRVHVSDPTGVVLVATATRAASRARRWSTRFDGPDAAVAAMFGEVTMPADVIGIERLPARIDLDRVFER